MIDIDIAKELCYETIAAIHSVRSELGAGLNEYVYQEGLELELIDRNILYEREKAIRPSYRGTPMKAEFRLDFLCEKKIIVECKAIERLGKDQCAQLFNYMHLTKMPIGILVNFKPSYMEIERYLYDEETDKILGFDGLEVSSFHTRYKHQNTI